MLEPNSKYKVFVAEGEWYARPPISGKEKWVLLETRRLEVPRRRI